MLACCVEISGIVCMLKLMFICAVVGRFLNILNEIIRYGEICFKCVHLILSPLE